MNAWWRSRFPQSLRVPWATAFEPAHEYRLVTALFVRLLALVYLIAFASIGLQITALAGSEGIFPFAEALDRAEAAHGHARFWHYPHLFWLNSSDLALQGAAILGCALSVLLFFHRIPQLGLVLLFALYLSLFQAGQVFMNFQWDYLLLESGFLAIFLPRGSRLVIWLFRWLLFRFRLLSGVVKLLSQDPSWSGLTALLYYFETQPLPHGGSWHAHQLPAWLLQGATGAALGIELVVPFMMLLPRGYRLFAAWATLLMQLLILLTSNHNFFNLLNMALCLFLFDDRALRHVVPSALARWLGERGTRTAPPGSARRLLLGAIAGVLLTGSSAQVWETVTGARSPAPLGLALDALEPFRIVNKYGVFPTIKTQRIEVIIEGSQDGTEWHPYVFRYKPGPVDRRPPVAIPHQPRLDWILWFVPGGHPLFLTTFERIVQRLRENAPAVTALLASNPFADKPPRFIRAALYRYRFTDAAVRARTGRWWDREYLGPFYPWPWPVHTPAR